MAIVGLRNTENFAADERPLSWREGILLRYPNGKAPLTALTSAMKSRSVDDPEFYWWEKEVQSRRMTLAANLSAIAGVQTITLTGNGLQVKEGDILSVEQTGELLYVSADPISATSIQVSRGWAGTTVAAVSYAAAGVNPNLMVIGSAYEEGSLPPTGVNFDPTKVYNYTQILRNTLEMTRTASKTRLRTKDQIAEAKRECLELHSMDMERAFLFSKRYEGVRNGQPVRMMNGIMNMIPGDNIKNVATEYSGGLTMKGLEEYMLEIFKFGSDEKMCFCGNRFALTMQQVLRKNAHWQFQSGIKEYGMNVQRLTSPFGELVLKTHPLFNNNPGGTTDNAAYYGMDSWGLVLDMAELQYVYFNGADTSYQPKLEDNGLDGIKSGYLTECSIELHHAKNHFVLKNVVAAAADPT